LDSCNQTVSAETLEILFEDRCVVVAIKPRGALSEAHEREENMPALLGGSVYPVHRLDRGVGGVMVYAKTREAAAKLSASVQQNKLKKEYTAILSGVPALAKGELRDYLFKDSAKNKSFVVDSARKGAKEAVLTYETVDTRPCGENALARVKIRLQTGRSHQIRVQFASRGTPLVGDGKYGSRIKAAYPALYATALSFPHPKTGKTMQFSAPVPGDFPWELFGMSQYEIERKYLIEYPDKAVLEAAEGVRVKRIEQTYLQAAAGETRRVRKMTENGATRYIETRKYRVSALRATEEEKELSVAEYKALLQLADPALRPIYKTRYAIPYAGHIAEVDLYDFWQDRATVEVELSSENERAELPPYLRVIREVSDDKRYKNVNLAKELPEN
jgi:23S rRNA pseudouridine1911/1915/1917 synthase